MLRKILETLSPTYCLWCYKKNDLFLCPEHLEIINSFLCPVCHLKFPEIKIKKITCPSCSQKTYLDGLFPIFRLNEPLEKLIHSYKYDLYFDLVKTICFISKEFIYNKFKDFYFIPIPSHKSKIKERGFDHIRLILENMNLKILDALLKIKKTKPQAQTEFLERSQNIKDAFVLKEKNLPEVLFLFDDIKTTGSTLNEACKILKQGGAKLVFALTLATK